MTSIVAGAALIVAGVTGCSDSKDDTTAAPTPTPTATATPTPEATTPAEATATSVDVTLMDFKVQPSATSAKSGKVEFHVKNNGPSVHEFVVVASDLAPDKLPLKGTVIDEAALKPVDELEDLAKDSNTTLKVDLPKGKYVLICNVSGHYQAGMHAGFTAE